MTKRLSTEAQLFDLGKQEMDLKRKALDRVEMLDAENKEEMKVLKKSINALTAAVSNRFNMLHQFMQQHRAPSNMYGTQPNKYFQYPMQNMPRESHLLENRNQSFQALGSLR